MSIEYKKSVATFHEHISVEEAEGLLEWLIKNPKGKINLAACEHLHAANLQVLMAVKPVISAMPNNQDLQMWIEVALK